MVEIGSYWKDDKGLVGVVKSYPMEDYYSVLFDDGFVHQMYKTTLTYLHERITEEEYKRARINRKLKNG